MEHVNDIEKLLWMKDASEMLLKHGSLQDEAIDRYNLYYGHIVKEYRKCFLPTLSGSYMQKLASFDTDCEIAVGHNIQLMVEKNTCYDIYDGWLEPIGLLVYYVPQRDNVRHSIIARSKSRFLNYTHVFEQLFPGKSFEEPGFGHITSASLDEKALLAFFRVKTICRTKHAHILSQLTYINRSSASKLPYITTGNVLVEDGERLWSSRSKEDICCKAFVLHSIDYGKTDLCCKLIAGNVIWPVPFLFLDDGLYTRDPTSILCRRIEQRDIKRSDIACSRIACQMNRQYNWLPHHPLDYFTTGFPEFLQEIVTGDQKTRKWLLECGITSLCHLYFDIPHQIKYTAFEMSTVNSYIDGAITKSPDGHIALDNLSEEMQDYELEIIDTHSQTNKKKVWKVRIDVRAFVAAYNAILHALGDH